VQGVGERNSRNNLLILRRFSETGNSAGKTKRRRFGSAREGGEGIGAEGEKPGVPANFPSYYPLRNPPASFDIRPDERRSGKNHDGRKQK